MGKDYEYLERIKVGEVIIEPIKITDSYLNEWYNIEISIQGKDCINLEDLNEEEFNKIIEKIKAHHKYTYGQIITLGYFYKKYQEQVNQTFKALNKVVGRNEMGVKE